MSRIYFAAILAGAGFAAAAIVAPLSAQQAASAAGEQTRAEALARADQRFDQLDANKDGKLTPDELAAGRAPRGDAPPPPAGATPGRFGQRMFARMDTNNDGVVDRAEYRANAAQRFDRIDTNKDGKIDAGERKAAREAMMGAMGGHHSMPMQDGGAMPPPPPPSDPNTGH